MGGNGRLALVTGGAGFIGSHLVEGLVEDGWQVRVFDDFSSGRKAHLERVCDRIEILRGDVTDANSVASAAAGADVVFHQAAIASIPRCIAEPIHTFEVNLRGTLNVLEASRRNAVRRVVFASSCAVYGNAATPPVRETDPPDPISPYAVQKLASEHYLRLYTDLHGLETVSLRYFNVYGDRQDPSSDYAAVVPRFLTAACKGESLRIHGDGEQTRDFIHVLDVARVNRMAADASKVSGGCFNVASGRGTRVSELADVIARSCGRDVRQVAEPPRAGDVRDSWGDGKATLEALGFVPEIELATGIRRMLERVELGGSQ